MGKWFEDMKKFVVEGFEEIVRNPALLNDVMDETVEDLEGHVEDVKEVIENAKPVINALVTLIDVVGQMKQGHGTRALHKPTLHIAGLRLADKIDVPEDVE